MIILTKVQNDFIEGCLKDLDFVSWDRFIDYIQDGKRILRIYDWIAREDNYQDFIMLEILLDETKVSYLTSSNSYTQEISKILYGNYNTHNICRRVENIFKVKNCIKLK